MVFHITLIKLKQLKKLIEFILSNWLMGLLI